MALYSKWVKISRIVANVGFFTTSFAVILFISLTVFFVKKKVGSYRFLLILFPILGFFFSSFEFFMHPFFHNFDSGITLFSLAHFPSSSLPFHTALLCAYTGLYSMTIALLALQFLYRYWAVFRPELIAAFFDGPRFCFSVLYSLFFGAFWSVGMHVFCRVDDSVHYYFNEEILESYGLIFSEQAAIATIAFDKNGSVRWVNALGTMDITVNLMFQYSIIIFCAVRMGMKMKEKISLLSPSLRRMHNQLYRTLLLQITLPTVTLVAPVFFLIYVPFFNMTLSIPTGIFLSTFALYPAMDCLIVIFIVSHYKNALRKMFRMLKSTKENYFQKSYPVS